MWEKNDLICLYLEVFAWRIAYSVAYKAQKEGMLYQLEDQ